MKIPRFKKGQKWYNFPSTDIWVYRRREAYYYVGGKKELEKAARDGKLNTFQHYIRKKDVLNCVEKYALSAAKKKPKSRMRLDEIEVDERKLIEEMEEVYGDMTTFHSDFVVIPDFFDKLRERFPRLSKEQFLKVLEKLSDEVIVDLHAINNRSNVKRPDLSIKSSFGVLYYVSWR